MKKKVYIAIVVLVVAIVLGIVGVICLDKSDVNGQDTNFEEGQMGMPPPLPEEESAEVTSAHLIQQDEEFDGTLFETSKNDEVALATKNNAKVNLSNITVNKTGNTDSIFKSDMYGINSGIFIGESKTKLVNGKITTNAIGANGVYVKGNNANLEIKDTVIETIGERARGIDVLDKGKLNGDNLIIKTTGDKSSAIATDRGGGFITINNSNIVTDGIDSAGIYSTGSIKVTNSTIVAKQAEGAVIESDNSIELENVNIETNKKRGIMIMSSVPMQQQGNGIFRMSYGKLTVKEGPVFYVTNTTAMIDLENVEINSNSGVFLEAKKDETEELQQEGKLSNNKGGTVVLTCINQKISGKIVLDENSKLTMNLTKNSNYTGEINKENIADFVEIIVDETSIISLTDNCYVDTIKVEDYSNLKTNGYNIYYKNSEQDLTNLQLDGGVKFIKL